MSAVVKRGEGCRCWVRTEVKGEGEVGRCRGKRERGWLEGGGGGEGMRMGTLTYGQVGCGGCGKREQKWWHKDIRGLRLQSSTLLAVTLRLWVNEHVIFEIAELIVSASGGADDGCE